MRCLTMLRAKVLVLSALALGCTRSVPSTRLPADATPAAEAKPKADAEETPKTDAAANPKADAGASPKADGSSPSGDPPLVKIVAFDCEKYDVLPNETPPKG